MSKFSDTSGKTLFCKVNARDNAGNLGIKSWEYQMEKDDSSVAVSNDSQPELPVEEEIEVDATPKSDTQKGMIVWDDKLPKAVKPGTKVRLQGRIETEVKKPLPVKVTLIAPNDTVYVSQIYTNAKGIFELNAPMDLDGEWRLLAAYEEDENEPIISDTLKIQVTSDKAKIQAEKSRKGFFGKKMLIGIIVFYVLIIALYR